MHVFERAGLGAAPYRFTGVGKNVFQACPGAPAQAGGSCDYCGTGIMFEFHLTSADGHQSKVGCDCINKSGDKGLIQAYKTSPQYRMMVQAKKTAKNAAVLAELNELIASKKAIIASMPHPRGFRDFKTNKPQTLLDDVMWQMRNCGASGRATLLSSLKKALGAGAIAGKSPE